MGRGNYLAYGGDCGYQWYVDNDVWNWDDDTENIRAMHPFAGKDAGNVRRGLSGKPAVLHLGFFPRGRSAAGDGQRQQQRRRARKQRARAQFFC